MQVVPINSCKVEREEKCFDYEEHQCKYDTKTHEEDISWEDEKLTNNPEPRQLCADVKVCKKVPKEEKRYKRIPEKKCEQVPKQRQQCRTVMVPQPPIVRFIKIEYFYFKRYLETTNCGVRDRIQATML